MKKTLRKITVNNKEMLWLVSNYNGDGDGGIELKVFMGRTLFLKKWLTGNSKPKSVTPGFVKQQILLNLA